MKKIFRKADYRASIGDLTCEVAKQLGRIGLTVESETLCAVVKTSDTKFKTSDGEGSSVAIETYSHHRRIDNELASDGFVSLTWNTRSGHVVKISESWSGISSLGGLVVVEIGDDESKRFYPSVIQLLGEIPLLNKEYMSGEEKIVVAIDIKFRYNGKAEVIGPTMTLITIGMARELVGSYPKVVRLWEEADASFFSDEEKKEEIKKYLWGEVEKNHPEYGPSHGAYGSANEVCRIFYKGDVISLLEKNPSGGSKYVFLELPHKVFDEWLQRPPFVHEDWA